MSPTVSATVQKVVLTPPHVTKSSLLAMEPESPDYFDAADWNIEKERQLRKKEEE